MLQIASKTGTSTQSSNRFMSDPAPILRQFILNQLSNGEALVSAGTGAIGGFLECLSPDNAFGLGAQLQTAAEQLSSGNIAGAIETATQALFLAPVIYLGLARFAKPRAHGGERLAAELEAAGEAVERDTDVEDELAEHGRAPQPAGAQ